VPEVADLLILQQKLRLSGTKTHLGHLLVNDISKITPCETAVFWHSGTARTEAVSGLPEPARNSPFTDWIDLVGKTLSEKYERNPVRIDPSEFSQDQLSRWKEFLASEVVWVPLTTADKVVGGLLLSRQTAWSDEELNILGYWGLAAGHAVDGLWNKHDGSPPWWRQLLNRRYMWIAVAVLILMMFFPVDLSVNASAEVVPKEPDIVRAPIEGIIGEVLVEPNQRVEAGELILTFDDTAIKAQLDVVQQELAIAQAEYQRANQAAVSDRREASQLPMLKARVEQRDAQRRYNQSLLDRSRIYAEEESIAVVPDVQDLEGRPVKVGEKILTLAKPKFVELEFWLAVGDSIPLPEKAKVALFLNVYPDVVHRGQVRYISYQAEVSPEGILGFRGRADFEQSDELRVGWRGTAKVTGESVSLAYYLFRRPLSVLRQWTGV
jgi:hypothetical protein